MDLYGLPIYKEEVIDYLLEGNCDNQFLLFMFSSKGWIRPRTK